MLLGAELAVSVYAERVSGERAAEHEAQEWHPKGDLQQSERRGTHRMPLDSNDDEVQTPIGCPSKHESQPLCLDRCAGMQGVPFWHTRSFSSLSRTYRKWGNVVA